jgi:hypothetical protein
VQNAEVKIQAGFLLLSDSGHLHPAASVPRAVRARAEDARVDHAAVVRVAINSYKQLASLNKYHSFPISSQWKNLKAIK